MNVNWEEIKHFKPSEFGPRPDMVDPALIRSLDALREKAGVAIHVHCSWAKDGHSQASKHYTGQAADIHFGGALTREQEFNLILSIDAFRGIGFYPRWKPKWGWHVDTRLSPRVVWFDPGYHQYISGLKAVRDAVKQA